jgi:hypothetical protein
MVSSTFFKSIGGSKGSAPINTHATALNNDGDAWSKNLKRHVSHQGEQPSEPNRRVPEGPNIFGSVSVGSNANARTKDVNAKADKFPGKSNKVI